MYLWIYLRGHNVGLRIFVVNEYFGTIWFPQTDLFGISYQTHLDKLHSRQLLKFSHAACTKPTDDIVRSSTCKGFIFEVV